MGIGVRTGLHTGEVELMGDDIGGIAVHVGARIAEAADPGEVLVCTPPSISSPDPASTLPSAANTSSRGYPVRGASSAPPTDPKPEVLCGPRLHMRGGAARERDELRPRSAHVEGNSCGPPASTD